MHRPLEPDPDPLAYIAALEAENTRLRDEVDYLKQKFGHYWVPPIELHLTGKEGQLLALLLKGRLLGKDQILLHIYSDRPDSPPEIKIIDVFVCKLRKKIKPFGVLITTVWGRGYQMSANDVEAFFARWPEERANLE